MDGKKPQAQKDLDEHSGTSAKAGGGNNFEEDLRGIKEAEAEKERALAKARADYEKIISDANVEAKKIIEKAGEEAERLGDEVLTKARKGLETKERQIMARAHKEADEISAMAVPQGAVDRALEKIMAKL